MRIQSGGSHTFAAQRTKSNPSKELFSSVLLEKEAEKTEDKQGDEKKGKLVTCKEGAYVRQYIVRPDGTKILLSEAMQAEEESISPVTAQHRLTAEQRANEDGMTQNAKDVINLLNMQAGAGMHMQFKFLSSIEEEKG
ncbi:hypothetical protein [Paenibacillus apiarius]|uniref:hypothetical protein n=1 Tax=Paenibacillus apiarius TaxID=46240 RepID=UPI003B3BDC54